MTYSNRHFHCYWLKISHYSQLLVTYDGELKEIIEYSEEIEGNGNCQIRFTIFS